ncbi:MAG: tetratricopeptide repeat-containing glycosyltransferase family protein [Bryobacteraceae bacterium]|nr:tetratricopeptide repeat-containing glycosyltransferase family protein [Bryobacteraceae bacterium]
MRPLAKTEFETAQKHHRSGRLRQAERVLAKLLAREPEHAAALDLLGLIAAETGQMDTAVALIGQAIRLAGPLPSYCAHLGAIFERQRNLLGAIECYRQAAGGDPGDSPIRWRLANALHQAGHLAESLEHYRAFTALEPSRAEGWFNLAVTQAALGRAGDAHRSYERALELDPRHAQAWNNLGILLHHAGRPDRAEEHYRRALGADPAYAQARYNLGLALQQAGRLEEAAAEYRRTLRENPAHGEAHNNLGNVLLAANDPRAARECYRAAIAVSPGHVEANWNRAIADLLLGDYETGWAGYEWRFAQPGAVSRHAQAPRWNPQNATSGPVLLWAEQGLGDALQFIRYAPLVAEAAGEIFVECHAPLIPLIEPFVGTGRVFPLGADLPPFAAQIPLMSLPAAFHTTLDSIPPAPYLAAPAARGVRWAEILEAYPPPRVGLVWAGNPGHKNDRNRSLPPESLAPLTALPATFFTLQPDAEAPAGVVSLAGHIRDFADTAAAIERLDLTISVDTSVAHLAGALGRPIWTLLPHAPDWRWLLDRRDSPWYPSMRLYRQPSRGDWESVVREVAADLTAVTRRYRR